MFTAPSMPTRVLFVLCCTTQLVVWSGCSRMMSPPGQRLFGQNNPSAPDSNEWNLTPTDREPSPYAADSLSSQSNLGDQNSLPLSRQEALQAQFAQSYQVPEKVPPRLIPIESVRFPGDEAAEVVTASATMTDQSGAREALALEFSDDTNDPNNQRVKQAALLRDRPATTAATVAPSMSAKQPIAPTPSPAPTNIQTAPMAQTASASPVSAATSKDPKSSHVNVAESSKSSTAANSFKPDEFQAARRATKPVSKESSPSDLTALQGNSATAKSDTKIVSPSDIAINPSKFALDAKPTTPAAAPSDLATNGTLKMELPAVEKISDPKTMAKPLASSIAKTTINPSKNLNKTEPSGDTALISAGIKVDKNAFEISVPAKTKTEFLKPKAKTQPFKNELLPATTESEPDKLEKAQPHAKSELTPAKPGNSLTLTSKPIASRQASAQSQASAAPADSSKKSCETPLSTKNQSADFCGTVSPKLDRLSGADCQVELSNKLPTVKDQKQANPSAGLAQINSQFQPSTPLKPSSNTAKAAADLSSTQPVLRPTAITKTKESLSELNLLDRNFPASRTSEKKPAAPSLPISKPISNSTSNSAAPIPSQFIPKSPQLTTHIERNLDVPALQLVNSQFCTEIKGFGQVTPFQSTRFKNNQRTLVYCEVENYNSQLRTNDKGTEYVTRFRGRYQIVDSKGNVVQSGQFPEIEDVTVRKRRDFYLYFPISLKDLQPANHVLKLAIEESTPNATGSDSVRVAEQTLQFTVE